LLQPKDAKVLIIQQYQLVCIFYAAIFVKMLNQTIHFFSHINSNH